MENDPGKRHLVWGTLEQRLRGRQQCVLIKSDTDSDTNSNPNCYTFAKRYPDTDRDAYARADGATGSRRRFLK